MEQPPAYTPSPRSIEGLRAQILANGSLLRPKSDPHHSGRSSGDHIELVVAKLTAAAATKPGAPAATASGAPTADKHYALLVQRTYSKKDVGIILKGEPRDSVEEALQWILERTETQIHEMVSRYGRTSSGDGCCVM
ncbi:hypothetical protein KC332_g16406 [Hortaea werneckii]|uniref:Uncharacterized protein n=1 Tax=Hortaea werneckii TaxID=91943 RepID=A0A3M7I0V0_HORWE|nr:hypothetical protein KC358_g5560 [Hortaea werneckii]KAI6852072.1 hypothetical protein KC350_g1227 [Hortaea werneckii]KAI6939416.1 hypothetical protein KC341_g4224 [Hortaea werneckii]KAI6946893.1 hypothetical protein KC348_g2863 [Hortaea werneckii]KAI6973185.1 hypothetical protein KC321_g5818 [Hortaea werneckii]